MKVSTFAALGREVATYLEQFAIVAGVFVGVAFVVNLSDGFGDRAVALELEDIDIVLRFDDAVCATF